MHFMTQRQHSNIDEYGNVLWLDEERLARKAMGYEPYTPPKKGLGIVNFLKEHISARPWNMGFIHRIFYLVVGGSRWMKEDSLRNRLYRWITMIAPEKKKHTSAVVLPLDVDLTDAGQKVPVPMDFLKESLRHTTCIVGMPYCICREAGDCQDYPHDLACLFIGEGARTLVRHGLAEEFTYEQACERIDRAAEMGLFGHAVWIEVEQLLWGIPNQQMDQFMEICFCCPCCCVGVTLAANGTRDVKQRFHPVGWTAVADTAKCTGCGLCISGPHGCPQEAITFGADGKIQINQEYCVGCGLCKARCRRDVIKIKQTMPMRENMNEYFEKEFNIDVKVWNEEYTRQ